MKPGITRRAVLALLPGALAAARKRRPPARRGEFVPFVDPVTEAWVLRLTALSSASVLPAPQNRFISSRRHFLVFSSDRTGAMSPFHLDLRNGIIRRLAETRHLATHSLCLDPRERFVYYIDGGVLQETAIATRKTRAIAEDVTAFGVPCSGSDFAILRHGRLFRLQSSQPLAEDVATGPFLNANGNACFFGRESKDGHEFWFVPLAVPAKPKLLARGRIWNPFWSPDGKSVLFLRDIETKTAVLSEIHQVHVATGVEQKVDPTSEYAAFAPNADATVFVGASRSLAQPDIILLLRSVAREMTLCEHGASHPASVTPVFSPNSKAVFFQSDREGKPALYAINVEKFVDAT